MNDEDKKLLELYIKESKKKRMIILIVILFFLFLSVIIYGKYYFKNLSLNDDFNNNVNTIEEKQSPLNEIVNNINCEIVSENTTESDIQNKENSVVKNTQEQSSKEDKTKTKKESQPSKNSISQTNNKKEENTSSKPQNKDFLFVDGYTMENVSQIAQEYLKASGYPGECVPLKDSEGVYLGMRVVFY